MAPRVAAIAVVGMYLVLAAPAARAEDEAPPAPAAQADAGTSAEADTLIRRGLELRLAGHDREALAEFRHAYELTRSPRALAHVGLSEQALGEWRAADEHVRAAVSSEDDPWIQKNRQLLEQALGVILSHVAELDSADRARTAAASSASAARATLIARPQEGAGGDAVDAGRRYRIAAAAAAATGVALLSAGIVFSINVGTDSNANHAGQVFSPDREQSGKRAESLQWVCYSASVGVLGAAAALAAYAHQLGRADRTTARAAPLVVPFVTADGGGGGLVLTVRR